MHLGEVGAEEEVLGDGAEPVPPVAIEGHPACLRVTRAGKAGSEGEIGDAGNDRGDEGGHRRRVVLVVGMEQDDHGGAQVERLPVAGLLIAAVAPVAVMDPDVDTQPPGEIDGPVREGVVDQQEVVSGPYG